MSTVPAAPVQTVPEHVDVLIVGAGISGIGCAYHLQDKQPGRSYAILEGRDAIGGTWDLFRYPGIRSDSDLHTFGYAFKPWTHEKAIADGADILAYVREAATENGIDRHIHFGHRVEHATWSTAEARWTVRARRADGTEVAVSASWLFCAGGYYRHDAGFTPEFPGVEDFVGKVVHPQQWPEDLDYTGKRVVVIGSGATAVTLIPAMTDRAAHVTMLQRSPSYILPVPSEDPIAKLLSRFLPAERAYAATRRKNVWQQTGVYAFCQRFPKLARRLIRSLTAKQLPEGFDVDTHFSPKYDPWDQRLCAVPDGDLFRAIRRGDASMVTDHIDTFTADGIRLRSGAELEADFVVSATGLNLIAFGGITFTVDGADVALPDTMAYKGMMLSGLPNFAYAIGYTNSSWTLKVDLVCEHLCRLLDHMDAGGHEICTPGADDPANETRPLLDFAAGYVQRAMDTFPRQGSRAPWQLNMSYGKDVALLRAGPIADDALTFGARSAGPADDRVTLAV